MSCIFCRVANKEVPAKIVHETPSFIAFDDISPQAPVHVVVIPKAHIKGIDELKDCDVFSVIEQVANKKGVDQTGFRVVLNHGSDAGQAVEHVHFHVLGGRKLNWPPG